MNPRTPAHPPYCGNRRNSWVAKITGRMSAQKNQHTAPPIPPPGFKEPTGGLRLNQTRGHRSVLFSGGWSPHWNSNDSPRAVRCVATIGDELKGGRRRPLPPTREDQLWPIPDGSAVRYLILLLSSDGWCSRRVGTWNVVICSDCDGLQVFYDEQVVYTCVRLCCKLIFRHLGIELFSVHAKRWFYR